MDVSQMMKIIFLLSAWSVQALQSNRKVPSNDCEPLLSSVRMEVSPVLLKVMCSTTNSITLVVDCGTNDRYERVAGLCSSFDLNIGKVLMSQPLLSSTITLQLVQSGQVLDTAKVALLSSDQLFNYRITVWSNRNTRFVLAIAKECRHSKSVELIDTLTGTQNSIPEKPSQRLPVVPADNQLPKPSHDLRQSHPQSPVKGDFDTPLISEHSHLNKLENVQQTSMDKLRPQQWFLNTQKMQSARKENASIDEKASKIEIYRSRLLRPGLVKTTPSINLRFQYDMEGSEDDAPTATTESSELAKLRWMEEKRIIFEKKMKFLRNFNPEADGSTPSETEDLSLEEDEEPMEFSSLYLSKNFEKLPDMDFYQSTDVTANSGDAFMQEKEVSEPNPFRRVQMQHKENYYDLADDHPRRSAKIARQVNEVATSNMGYQELRYRLLDSSNLPALQNNGNKLKTIIQATRATNQSTGTNQSAAVLPFLIAKKATINKRQEIQKINTNTYDTKADLLKFNVTSASLIKDMHTFTDDKGSSAVLTQPFRQREQSIQNTQTLPHSVDNIATYTTLLHTSPIYNTNKDLNYSKNLKLFVGNLTATPETRTASNFLQRSLYSQNIQSVTVSNNEVETRRTLFQELSTIVPVTVSTLRDKIISQLQSIVPDNLQTSVHKILKNGLITSPFKTTTSGTTSAQSVVSTNVPILFTRSIPNTLTEQTTGSIVNNLPEKFTSEQETSFISSSANYLHLEEFKNAKVNTPSVSTSLRTKSQNSLPEGYIVIGPMITPKPLSYPRSSPLEMRLSNVQQPPIQSRYFNDVDVKASPQPSILQDEPKQAHRITRQNINETKLASQRKTINTLLHMTKNVNVGQIMVAAREFEGPSTSEMQTFATSPGAVPRNSSVQEIQETQTNPLSSQDVNASVLTESFQTSTITLSENPQTTESLELPETSQIPRNTGTPQANDEELADMEKDSFWPIVAGLVIGVPAVVVLIIAIAVIHRKSKTDPQKLFHMKALRDSRHASVVTLQAEIMERRRQDSAETILQEIMVTPRRESRRDISQDIARPHSIDV